MLLIFINVVMREQHATNSNVRSLKQKYNFDMKIS